MRGRRSLRIGAAMTAAIVLLDVGVGGGGAGAQPPRRQPVSGVALSPVGTIEATKSPTSRLAETDPALLGRTDATPIAVVIKLDYDSVATYEGTVAGLPATSPAVTGRELSGVSAAETKYDAYVAGQEADFESDLAAAVPGATVGQSLRTVYGGVTATVPANRVADVLALPNVVAVQSDALSRPLTDSSPELIGATTLYPALGGASLAGQGVILGVLDSGAWPEHPSFADQGNLGAPPPRADGTPRECDFGDNPLTPAADPFGCNNKLIGGAAFLDTYLSNPARAAAEMFHSARDSDGHGTHTGSTSAGNVVASAPVLGVERGPIHGIAPGAWVSVYKVCGVEGCFSSDSAAAVAQAILDGVDVINFSISGGVQPFSDPVELAFLDAYAAGVFVSASAGNDGPGPSTANHLSPWVTSVAASTQRREFQSTLTLTSSDSATASFVGASITAGVGPLPIVLASAAPYSDALCGHPAPPGTFTGKIVACQRGVQARVVKGFNVTQGGAAGMILFNPALADVETDTHYLPTVHLADGTPFVAFMGAHPNITGQFTAGVAASGPGDVMAAFSSRGPAGFFVKPDITAPGVQILAGDTPIMESNESGPAGEYFQAIAGTSMSSPHIAGSAILLAALHPEWTPGQIKSAMMTTAYQQVVKENGVTHADAFDYGSGRIDLTVAGAPGLTFDETAERMAALGSDPITSIHLNIPSINAPVLPGSITTVRTAMNVSGRNLNYKVRTTAPTGSKITVKPDHFDIKPGESVSLSITITSSAPTAQYFGEIRLVSNTNDLPALHLPVAFVPQQGKVNLTSDCTPDTIKHDALSTCTVTAQNNTFKATTVDLSTSVDKRLEIRSATGAVIDKRTRKVVRNGASLAASVPGVPALTTLGANGYFSLTNLGIAPRPVGDETIVNFSTSPFVYAGKTYDAVGVDSNGYLVVGGATAEDNECCLASTLNIPNAARPNNVLAPFWTDLDGTGAPGIQIAEVTDGVKFWFVAEWHVNVFGTTSERHFQVWIGLNGVEDITFDYEPNHFPADPNGQPFVVGAENEIGTGGARLPGLPTEDLRVVSSAPTPGASVSYTVTVKGKEKGVGTVTSEMISPDVPGVTRVTSKIQITKK